MKTKYPSMFGLLAVFMLVASLVVPANLASPAPVSADPGICKWDTLMTPGYLPLKNDVASKLPGDITCGYEPHDMAVGGDGATVLLVAQYWLPPIVSSVPPTGTFVNQLFYTNNNGLSFTGTKYTAFVDDFMRFHGISRATYQADETLWPNVWLAAIAPDDPTFWAIVTDREPLTATGMPQEVWITETGGNSWDCTNFYSYLTSEVETDQTIRTIDISVDYGGRRDIAVGTVDAGDNTGDVYVVKSTGFTGWNAQGFDGVTFGLNSDFYAVKFSPTYAGDASLVMVYADAAGTYYNIALRDIDRNEADSLVYTLPGVVIPGAAVTGTPPAIDQLNKVDLELPSDFSGQAASLRRAYVSLDCYTDGTGKNDWDGIVRIDDTIIYVLMDTFGDNNKSIYSIAYYGTYASGKLLAGERMGFPCTATVPTWFTDSPTTCPIPCWYPALKPTTGAAGIACSAVQDGVGAALVGWKADGQLAFAVTGSHALIDGANTWFLPWRPVWLNHLVPPFTKFGNGTLVILDESAFAISRNNGETWNQIALIDTIINKFTDVAPSDDCSTIYLASVNREAHVAGYPSGTLCISANVSYDGSNCEVVGDVADSHTGTGVGNITWDTKTITVTTDNVNCECDWIATANVSYTCLCECDPTIVHWASGSDTGSMPFSCVPPVPSWDVVEFCVDWACNVCGCTYDYDAPCSAFDSVWRTSSNPTVVSPYPPLQGLFWERVLTRVTAPTCEDDQTDAALLRLVPYCDDPTGQIVAWGVYDHDRDFEKGIAAWSPDYGDYWANITPRDPIQDFCFDSSTVMYFLGYQGQVQKMPYTGTSWSSMLASVDTIIYGAHTIAAYAGNVLVGADRDYHANLYAASFSGNFDTDNPSFTVLSLAGGTEDRGDVHVAFDPNFEDNDIIFIADEIEGSGSVYRNTSSGFTPWSDANMMAAANGAVGCGLIPHATGQFGVALAQTGEALYSAHGSACRDEQTIDCAVARTIDDGTGSDGPLSGMPKPGIVWDCLDVFVNAPATGPCFTLEPSSLKACGCCELDTDTTLYAIDDADYSAGTRLGLVWGFTDCLAKAGPALITEDGMLIGCDPVSGRAQEVNFCWEQLCVADTYDIEISKNPDFTIKVIDWVFEDVCEGLLAPASVTEPCAFFPAGGAVEARVGSAIAAFGNLECGHKYYWRIKVRSCATTQLVRSRWSEARSFTVKAGLPVTTPYYGPQLLSPNNGCIGCPVSPASFSWSPFKETTSYKFQLASDAAMTDIIAEDATGATTAYEYTGTLDYSTNYFWRVMSVEPAPSDWSATFSFQTAAAPAAPAEAPEAPATPLWVWVVIALGAILVIVTLVLIFKTRRV